MIILVPPSINGSNELDLFPCLGWEIGQLNFQPVLHVLTEL